MSFEVTRFVCLCLIANFVIITDKHKIVAATPLNIISVSGTEARALPEMALFVENTLHPATRPSRIGRTRLLFDNNGKFKSSEEERNGEMVNIAHIVVQEI